MTKPHDLHDPAASGEDAHAIAVTVSLHELRPRTLKHGDTFAVLDRTGDALPVQGGPEGLYHRDTRHLSRLELTVAGLRPLLLSSASADDGGALTCDLTNPDLIEAGRPLLARDQVHIRRTKFLREASCFERIAVRNFADQPVVLRLELCFGADFADLFEVRGEQRPHRGEMHPPVTGRDAVTLAYMGLDGRRRATRLRFDPPPSRLGPDRAVYALELPPGESGSMFIETCCESGNVSAAPAAVEPPAAQTFLRAFRGERRDRRTAAARAVAIETSDTVFDETLRCSASDLGMLVTATPDGPFPYAGIPWFSTVFGRDALITALLTLWLDPRVALGVLRHLAALQATATDPAADAEPGKILHEMRNGEMAELGEVPFRRYYGSSIRRRSPSCSRASTSTAPATSPRCARSGPASRPRWAGSSGTATATATASSNTAG
jgi:glycogen debranching enzyme